MGEDSTAVCLNSINRVLSSEAVDLAVTALDGHSRSFGETHPAYGSSLSTFASLHQSMKITRQPSRSTL